MKVKNEIHVYEVDGKDVSSPSLVSLTVRSHWNRDSLVVFEFEGKSFTVSASSLEKAIKNATNWKY